MSDGTTEQSIEGDVTLGYHGRQTVHGFKNKLGLLNFRNFGHSTLLGFSMV